MDKIVILFKDVDKKLCELLDFKNGDRWRVQLTLDHSLDTAEIKVIMNIPFGTKTSSADVSSFFAEKYYSEKTYHKEDYEKTRLLNIVVDELTKPFLKESVKI